MRISRLCSLVAALTYVSVSVAAALPSVAQTNNDAVFGKFTGEVRWGQVFQRSLGQALTFEIELLGDSQSSQIGAYISILNKGNPKGHQFVLLPKLINGSESNFIGVWVLGLEKPPEVGALRLALDRYRDAGYPRPAM